MFFVNKSSCISVMKSFSSAAVKHILLPSPLGEDCREEEGGQPVSREGRAQRGQQPVSRKGETLYKKVGALPPPAIWEPPPPSSSQESLLHPLSCKLAGPHKRST